MATAPPYLAGSFTGFSDGSPASTANFSGAYDSLSTGSDRCLAVVVGAMRDIASQPVTVASATYNGISMTVQQVAERSPGSANRPDISILYLKAPATGSNTLVINFTGGNAHNSYAILAVVYTNVDQTTQVDVSDGGTNTNVNGLSFDDLSATTTVADTRMVVGVMEQGGNDLWTADGSGTKRGEVDTGNNTTDDQTTALIDYVAATAQAYTDAGTISNSSPIAGVMMALKSAGDLGSPLRPSVTFIGI